MLKVFLVEDEIVVREGIRDSIDWDKTEFAFVGEAPDGEMALPLIHEMQPDILITDIKMPFMDGLELSRYVKKNMPGVKIIILSGHQEFEYAKKAISIGVEEYVLKPVSSQDLLKVLEKVACNIEKERKNLEYEEKMNKYISNNIELLKEQFLNNLIIGIIPSHIVVEEAHTLGISLFAKCYAVISVSIDIDSETDYYQYLKVDEVINGIIMNKPNIIKFKRSINEIVLILKGDVCSSLDGYCQEVSAELENSVKAAASCRVSVDRGSVQERIQGIAKSYNAIREAKVSGINTNTYDIVMQQELRKLNENQRECFNFDENQVLSALRYEKKENIQQIIDKYFERLKDKKISVILSVYLAVRINLVASSFLEELGEKAEGILPKQISMEEMAMRFDTPEKLKSYIEGIIQSVYELREKRKNNIHFEMIIKAKKYIENNFSNPDMSLNVVAGYVNMSPCHFSTVFSQSTGETFIQYLTNIRMNEAKRLLNTTNMKTGEIALEIGYKDPHYFTYIFKKNVGCNPRDYRTYNENNNNNK